MIKSLTKKGKVGKVLCPVLRMFKSQKSKLLVDVNGELVNLSFLAYALFSKREESGSTQFGVVIHNAIKVQKTAAVAQRVRALAEQAKGWLFESQH